MQAWVGVVRHGLGSVCSLVTLLIVGGLLHPFSAIGAPVFPQASPTLSSSSKQPVRLAAVKKKSPRQPAGPALVIDLRTRSYPDRFRIVFDLQHSIKFSQTRKKRPDRVIVELQNTKLTRTVQEKVTDRGLPSDIKIDQSKPQSVTVSLNLEKISDYKLLPLKEPDRLVLEVYYPTDDRPVESAPPAAKAVPAPSPPVAVQTEEAPATALEFIPTPEGTPPPPLPTPAPTPTPPPHLKSAKRPARDDIKTIVIDAGHGGKDPGAIGRNKVAEKLITLKVALKLRDMIMQQLGRRVLMTRDRDVFIELEDRTKFANSHDADLFVSIHVNSHPQRSTRGLEVYHFGKASDRRALELAARENGTPIESTGVGWQYLVADLLTDKKIEESLELAWTTRQAMVNHLTTHYDDAEHPGGNRLYFESDRRASDAG